MRPAMHFVWLFMQMLLTVKTPAFAIGLRVDLLPRRYQKPSAPQVDCLLTPPIIDQSG